ncbi:MAG: TonB-dependent receptor domain-containing protein, partial [Acidobacteriota bacterium]
NPPSDVFGLPNLRIRGYVDLGNRAFLPNQKIPESFEVTDNLSFIRGNHSLTTGFTYRYQKAYFNIGDQARGNFDFRGVFTQDPQKRGKTGNEFADYLLGLPNNSQISNKFDGHQRNKYWGFYFQDDWKVTPKLTLNLGVRYELFYPEHEIDNKLLNFIIGPNKVIVPNDVIPEGIPADLVMPIPDGVDPRNLRRLDKDNWSPRIGFAYRLADRTVLRAGGGIFYGEGIYTFLGSSGRILGNPPSRIRNSFPSDKLFPEITLQDGFADDVLVFRGVTPSTLFRAHSMDMPSPYASHWSLNVQHELPWFLVDAGYTGSKGTNFDVSYNFNSPLPGPGKVAKRRPIQGFGTISSYQGMVSTNYHALLLKAERRFADGLAFLAAYTYGKAIDDGGEQFSDRDFRNVRDIKGDRGRSNFDLRQRFTSFLIWDLPWGTNRRWDLGSSWLNNVVGNWQFNLINTLRTGQPFTPQMAFSTANTGDARPNRICDGNLSGDQRSIDGWFDKGCFPTDPEFGGADATLFEFGNSGRTILDGPGAVNFDFSFFKRVPVSALGEQGEVQFRVELFNAFNTPQFARPDRRVDRGRGATIR